LPELERPALFHAVNFTWSMIEWWAVEVDNQTVLKTSVGVFLCPSAPRCEVPGFGRCDYRVNVGSSAAPLSENGTHGGPFGHIKMGTPATTTDGLSNTAAVSERVQGDWIRDRFRPRGDLRFIRDLKPLPLEPDPAIAACRDVADPPANVHESRGGESWFYTGYSFTGYNHAATPNFEAGCVRGEPNFELSARIKMAGVVPATSLHPGGVNVLMLDGSARFAKGAIDVRTWRALGTRGGGEVVGDW
jgi:prepilin-type processing-associated H-X9-DG protein